jgi:nucleoside-diphosphate-sugar epimerase
MKRVLVTGASGFIGRHCLRLVATQGYDEVHAANRRGADAGALGTAKWHVADLRDPQQAIRLIRELRPTHLLHAAWIATPGVYGQSPENKDWLAATKAMAEAVGEVGGARFVGVGSSAEYAPDGGPCREDETPIRPTSIYGQCKAECWLAVEEAGQRHGFSSAWGRVFLPYGPGDSGQRLVPSVVAALRAGRSVETTHGRQLRDFVFAPDIAAQLIRILGSAESGAFNVGTGRASSVRWVIESLAGRLGADPALLKFGAKSFPPSEPMELVADMEKVRQRLGMMPITSIEDGLGWVVAQPAA